MADWNSNSFPISDIRDWKELNRLEMQPDFQRRAVWGTAAKIMLMDTILSHIPMPKVFVRNVLADKATHRIIIDGQQRITAILDFLNDKFALEPPYLGPHKGKTYSELPSDVQNVFLQYQIDFNEIKNASDEEVREIFSRVNKYTVPLNSQELRMADFPGDFSHLSKQISMDDRFEELKIFTIAHRRRQLDIEYVSELIISLIAGPQDKTGTIDRYYQNYQEWDKENYSSIHKLFVKTLDEVSMLSSGEFILGKSRFKQKADFYSLFSAVSNNVSRGFSFEGKNLELLRKDLEFLDEYIAPESPITDLKNYAVKCVSAANSSSSRKWRIGFLSIFLNGTLNARPFTTYELSCLTRIKVEYLALLREKLKCSKCDNSINPAESKVGLSWPEGEPKQLTNLSFFHPECDSTDGIDVVTITERSDGELSVGSLNGELDF